MIYLSQDARIPLKYMNRHALITGQTGTGKTVSILRAVEQLSRAGVPTIAPDVKGDLPILRNSCPVESLTIGAGLSVPLWAMGADLIARVLELSDAQAGALEISFAYADEKGAPLNSLSDARALLAELSNAPDIVAHLGYITRASIGTIQRALLRIERGGFGGLFNAPAFDIASALDTGKITLLNCASIYQSPKVYGALMLYILRDIAARFPEIGDAPRPRLALVIDESHALFTDASPTLLRSIESTARLIRSKGVALVFASQAPEDLPFVVRAQCATRLEHSRAFGIGRAQFVTLDNAGRDAPARVVSVALPDCMAGARLAPPEPPSAPPEPPSAPPEPPSAPPEPEPEPMPLARLAGLAGLAGLAIAGGHAIAGAGGALIVAALIGFLLDQKPP